MGTRVPNYNTVGALAWSYKVLSGLPLTPPHPSATFDLSPVSFELRGQPASYFLITLPCTLLLGTNPYPIESPPGPRSNACRYNGTGFNQDYKVRVLFGTRQ